MKRGVGKRGEGSNLKEALHGLFRHKMIPIKFCFFPLKQLFQVSRCKESRLNKPIENGMDLYMCMYECMWGGVV